eukprot:749519-Hanusia_phi.AAC.2
MPTPIPPPPLLPFPPSLLSSSNTSPLLLLFPVAGVHVLEGFGYNGEDKKGRQKWDGVLNVDVRSFETHVCDETIIIIFFIIALSIS